MNRCYIFLKISFWKVGAILVRLFQIIEILNQNDPRDDLARRFDNLTNSNQNSSESVNLSKRKHITSRERASCERILS